MEQGFIIKGDFVPWQILSRVWRHFWLSQMEGCYWQLGGGGQGCCSKSYNTRDSPNPITKNDLAQNVHEPRVRNPELESLFLIDLNVLPIDFT